MQAKNALFKIQYKISGGPGPTLAGKYYYHRLATNLKPLYYIDYIYLHNSDKPLFYWTFTVELFKDMNNESSSHCPMSKAMLTDDPLNINHSSQIKVRFLIPKYRYTNKARSTKTGVECTELDRYIDRTRFKWIQICNTFTGPRMKVIRWLEFREVGKVPISSSCVWLDGWFLILIQYEQLQIN